MVINSKKNAFLQVAQCEDAQLPYFDTVPHDPSFEDMYQVSTMLGLEKKTRVGFAGSSNFFFVNSPGWVYFTNDDIVSYFFFNSNATF